MGADHLCALAVVAAPGESDLRPSDRARGARRTPNDAPRAEENLSSVGETSSAGHRSDVDVNPKHFARQTFLKSSALGVRWGLGHAAGLALVCAAFFSAKGAVSLDGVGDVTDKVVGASMVLLGVLALAQLRAWRRRRALERAHLNDALANAAADLQPHAEGRRMDLEARRDGPWSKTAFDHNQTARRMSAQFAPLEVRPGSAAHAHAHDLDLPHVHRERRMEEKDFSDAERGARFGPPGDNAARAMRNAVHANEHASDVELGVSSEDLFFSDAAETTFPRADNSAARDEDENKNKNEDEPSASAKARSRWSFAIGFSHGVASPSGILSVLPAVVLDDSAKASAYLVAFFITSTASMGAFAGAFGLVAAAAAAAAAAAPTRDRDPAARVSDAPVRVAMGLNLFAGAAAIAIGVAWLVLSATGKLGDL